MFRSFLSSACHISLVTGHFFLFSSCHWSQFTSSRSVIHTIQFPSVACFMRAHELTVFQLHVPLRAGPRFFVPPISRKQKRTALLNNLSPDLVALQITLI